LVPAVLREDLHAADRKRHRRRRILLLHVLLGGTADRPHVDDHGRQAHCSDDDPHGFRIRPRLGGAGGGRSADHHSGRTGHLFCPQLHRQGLCPGEGLMPTTSHRNRRWPFALAVILAIYGLVAFSLAMSLPVEDGERDWFAPLVPGGWMAWSF